MTIAEGNIYSFEHLEQFMQCADPGLYLIVEDVKQKQKAIMHIFSGNFCGDWKSGDGILFYDDREAHSANRDDQFRLIKILYMK